MPTHVPPPVTLTLLAPSPADRFHQPPPAVISLSGSAAATYVVTNLTTTKWRLYDPATDTTYAFPINPDSMTSPLTEKSLSFNYGVGAEYKRYSTTQGQRRPREWEFSGVIRSQEQHDLMDSWNDIEGVVHITDHLNRTFEVVIVGFEVTERKPTQNVRWRMRYTMKTLLLRQLT